jgi:nitroreductase
MNNTFLSNLDWRFATKKFDTSKKVSEADMNKILEAIQKAPTSYGLQPYHVYVITNPALREKMLPLSYNQGQVIEASHLLVFCMRTDVTSRIDSMIETLSGGTEEGKAALKGYSDMMYGTANSKSNEWLNAWTARQTYIALGFGLAACAELGIDSCPMEGFDSNGMDALLELPPHMKSLAYLAVGYRSAEPEHPKFRFSQDDLFTKN